MTLDVLNVVLPPLPPEVVPPAPMEYGTEPLVEMPVDDAHAPPPAPADADDKTPPPPPMQSA
jgi:hypothetical protein